VASRFGQAIHPCTNRKCRVATSLRVLHRGMFVGFGEISGVLGQNGGHGLGSAIAPPPPCSYAHGLRITLGRLHQVWRQDQAVAGREIGVLVGHDPGKRSGAPRLGVMGSASRRETRLDA
jgi:hypothetical protein